MPRCAVGLLGVLLLACSENFVSSYATVREAREAGAIQRGWVPASLPETATVIREAHDVDTNETWGAFKFPASDVKVLHAALVPIKPAGRHLRRPPTRIEWPSSLLGELTSNELGRAGLELFEAQSGGFFFAVDWRSGAGFFWREAS